MRLEFVQLLDASLPDDLCTRLREASDACPENAADAFDALGLEIAKRYQIGLTSFEDADRAANAMFLAMCHGRFFTDFFDSGRVAFRVYSAFDEGEYRHQGESDEIDPVKKYTDPVIALVLKEFANA